MVVMDKNIHRLLVGMYVLLALEESKSLSMIYLTIHSDIVDEFLLE